MRRIMITPWWVIHHGRSQRHHAILVAHLGVETISWNSLLRMVLQCSLLGRFLSAIGGEITGIGRESVGHSDKKPQGVLGSHLPQTCWVTGTPNFSKSCFFMLLREHAHVDWWTSTCWLIHHFLLDSITSIPCVSCHLRQLPWFHWFMWTWPCPLHWLEDSQRPTPSCHGSTEISKIPHPTTVNYIYIYP